MSTYASRRRAIALVSCPLAGVRLGMEYKLQTHVVVVVERNRESQRHEVEAHTPDDALNRYDPQLARRERHNVGERVHCYYNGRLHIAGLDVPEGCVVPSNFEGDGEETLFPPLAR